MMLLTRFWYIPPSDKILTWNLKLNPKRKSKIPELENHHEITASVEAQPVSFFGCVWVGSFFFFKIFCLGNAFCGLPSFFSNQPTTWKPPPTNQTRKLAWRHPRRDRRPSCPRRGQKCLRQTGETLPGGFGSDVFFGFFSSLFLVQTQVGGAFLRPRKV